MGRMNIWVCLEGDGDWDKTVLGLAHTNIPDTGFESEQTIISHFSMLFPNNGFFEFIQALFFEELKAAFTSSCVEIKDFISLCWEETAHFGKSFQYLDMSSFPWTRLQIMHTFCS